MNNIRRWNIDNILKELAKLVSSVEETISKSWDDPEKTHKLFELKGELLDEYIKLNKANKKKK